MPGYIDIFQATITPPAGLNLQEVLGLLKLLEPLPHLRGNFARTGGDALFVHAQDLLALHQDLAFADCCVNDRVHQAKDEMPEKIPFVEWGGRQVVNDGEISWLALGDLSQAEDRTAVL